MRKSDSHVLVVVLLASVLSVLTNAHAQVSVLTWHNDSWRTGQNTNETHLTTGSFANNGFGLLCKISLPSSPQQEQIYAQPLVVSNNDGSMSVYVATMQDNIYVFKVPSAWGPQTCAALQSTTPVSLLRGSLAGQYPADACFVGLGWNFQSCFSNGGRAICPSVGVLGTPVIEPNANIMYLVTESQDKNTEPEGQNCMQTPPQNFYHYLHALDLSPSNFLNETAGGPVQIAPPLSGGAVFQSKKLLQRPGLLHLNGAPTPTSPTIYMGFSMMDGTRPNPSGWVLAFDGGNLGLVGSQLAFATTPGNPNPNG